METTTLKTGTKKAGKLILSVLLFVVLIPFYVWAVLAIVNHVADFVIGLLILAPLFILGCIIYAITKYFFPKTHAKLY